MITVDSNIEKQNIYISIVLLEWKRTRDNGKVLYGMLVLETVMGKWRRDKWLKSISDKDKKRSMTKERRRGWCSHALMSPLTSNLSMYNVCLETIWRKERWNWSWGWESRRVFEGMILSGAVAAVGVWADEDTNVGLNGWDRKDMCASKNSRDLLCPQSY